MANRLLNLHRPRKSNADVQPQPGAHGYVDAINEKLKKLFFVDGPPKENIVIRWVDESGERRDPTTYASVYKWKIAYSVPYDKGEKKKKVEKDKRPTDERRRTGVRDSMRRQLAKSPSERSQDADERVKRSAPDHPLLSQDIVWFFAKNWTLKKNYKQSLGVKKTHRKTKLTLTLTYVPDEVEYEDESTEYVTGHDQPSTESGDEDESPRTHRR